MAGMSVNGLEERPFYGKTMFLDTIRNDEGHYVKPSGLVKETNATRDIEGAQSHYKWNDYKNKPAFFDSSDIFGTRSTVLHPQKFNKPCYYLTNDDIPGSKPKRTLFTTDRVVDPLNPVYPLPTTNLIESPPPKFLRDTINVDDIAGTKVSN
jgi:hypothetical protein